MDYNKLTGILLVIGLLIIYWIFLALKETIQRRGKAFLIISDVADPESFAIKLRDGLDSLSRDLKQRFSGRIQTLLNQYNDTNALPKYMVQDLVEELNKILQDHNLYKHQRFADVFLDTKTKNLLNKNPSGSDLILLNRRLLVSAYLGDLLFYDSPFKVFFYNLLFLAGIMVFLGLPISIIIYLNLHFWMGFIIVFGFIILVVFIIPSIKKKDTWDFTCPGSKVVSGELGGSKVHPIKSAVVTLYQKSGDDKNVQFITEGVTIVRLSDVKWELHILFSLYNLSESQINIYDIHAQEYKNSIQDAPVLTIDRSRIILYQDNSILSEGKIYDIPPGGIIPIDLKFQISRTPIFGYMSYLFGLFVDYHYLNNGILVKKRMPSDNVYMFQNPSTQWGTFLSISEHWLAHTLEDSDVSEHKKKTLLQLRNLLAKHGTLWTELH